MSDNKRPVPVALEDLLRLKRAERPPAEFWSEFDRQLRAKQLAALVEKRPWWHGLRHTVAKVGRYPLPLGAAAALAITFISLRDYAGPTSKPEATSPADVAVPTVTAAANDGAGLSRSVAVESFTTAAPVARDEAMVRDAMTRTETNSIPVQVAAVADQEPNTLDSAPSFSAVTATSLTAPRATPSARFIAANYAAAQDSMGTTLLAESHGFENRMTPARAVAIDPLQHMTPPGEGRRSTRFLTAMASVTMEDASARTTERVANRIAPEELYDQVRRFGTRRGGLNVKF